MKKITTTEAEIIYLNLDKIESVKIDTNLEIYHITTYSGAIISTYENVLQLGGSYVNPSFCSNQLNEK